MNKKRFKLSGLIMISAVASLGLSSCNFNNTTTKTQESISTSSDNNVVDNSTGSLKLNTIKASGLAPLNQMNSIDISVLTTTNSSALEEIEEDTTLEGSYYNGVGINTKKGGSINITLNNATIYQNNEEGKALYNVNKNVSVNIYLPKGTTSYIYNNYEDTNAVHIKGNLNITGEGTLVVISGSKSAIKCNGLVNIEDSTLNLAANNYGIHSQSVEIVDANINVSYAGKDGIRAEVENEGVSSAPEFDSSIGYVNLTNTTYNANVLGDGIQANTTLNISGGNINIKTCGSFVSYSDQNILDYELEDDDFKWIKSGDSYKKVSSDEIKNNYSKYLSLTQSSKGLKVDALEYTLDTNLDKELELSTTQYNITIDNEAMINLSTTDSAVKVDYGDFVIKGNSTLNIESGNKGVACDHDFYILDTNTTLNVTNSYEAVEACHLYFNGGKSYLSASDDGINVTTDYNTSDYSNLSLVVNDGLISVNAQGDGLDSNGSIYFNGGTTLVNGPTSGANESLDADSKIYFNGGFVFAVGASGMGSTSNYASETSNYVIENVNNSNTGNQLVKIIDSNGNVLLNVDVTDSFQELIFSSNLLTKGNSYTILIGSNSQTVTISQTVTSNNSNVPGGWNIPGGRR